VYYKYKMFKESTVRRAKCATVVETADYVVDMRTD